MRTAIVAIVIAALAGCTTQSANAQVWQQLDFGSNPTSQTVSANGVEVTVSPRTNADGNDSAILSVRIDGHPPILEEVTAAQFGWSIGIGRISSTDSQASVIVQTFSGGAHCCFSTVAYVPYADRIRRIEVGGGDGAGLESWPRDLDNDGTVDFELGDNSLLYAFSSYAGSFSLPTIVTIHRGNLIDVTDEPQFRVQFEDVASRARTACLDRSLGADRNGGCAAYVVAEARLGRLESALTFADREAYSGTDATFPTGCRIQAEICPSNQEISFLSFPQAIRWFLRRDQEVR